MWSFFRGGKGNGFCLPPPRFSARLSTDLSGMRRAFAIALTARILTCAAQETEVPEPTNTVFLEGLGQAIFWSANFEHTEYANESFAFHLRFGLGLWSTETVSSYVALPITFSVSYGDIHRAEAGAGFLFYNYGDSGPQANRVSETLFPTWHAGYRMQKEYGGLFLRAGLMFANLEDKLTFREAKEKWGYNPYVCVGTTF